MIQTCNETMGGIDLFDEKHSYHPKLLRIVKWQRRIFTQFLLEAVINAYILYKMRNPDLERSDDCYSLMSFIEYLIYGLVPSYLRLSDQYQENGCLVPVLKTTVSSKIGSKIECRRECKICRSRILQFCNTCDVPLCFATETGGASCWESYHKSLP